MSETVGIGTNTSTKSNNGVTEAVPGLDDIPYTLVVSNAGPGTDPAVEVRDSFPAGLAGKSFTFGSKSSTSGRWTARWFPWTRCVGGGGLSRS